MWNIFLKKLRRYNDRWCMARIRLKSSLAKKFWPRCYFIQQPPQRIFACQFECVMSENFLTNTPSLQRIPGNMLNKCRYRTMAISPDLWLWNRVLFFARWYNLGVVAILFFYACPLVLFSHFYLLFWGEKSLNIRLVLGGIANISYPSLDNFLTSLCV